MPDSPILGQWPRVNLAWEVRQHRAPPAPAGGALLVLSVLDLEHVVALLQIVPADGLVVLGKPAGDHAERER
jgi:hypothetical protein